MEPYIDFRFDGASEKELTRIYRESDIYISATHLPPPRNGFSWGLAIFEAIAAGLPALIVSTNDVREALADGRTALFFEPAHPEQIAAKAKMLMDNPEHYYSLASAAQNFVKEHMSWNAYAEQFTKLIPHS